MGTKWIFPKKFILGSKNSYSLMLKNKRIYEKFLTEFWKIRRPVEMFNFPRLSTLGVVLSAGHHLRIWRLSTLPISHKNKNLLISSFVPKQGKRLFWEKIVLNLRSTNRRLSISNFLFFTNPWTASITRMKLNIQVY